MTRQELRDEHLMCDREVSPSLRYIYKSLHIGKRGCPECAKLRAQEKKMGKHSRH